MSTAQQILVSLFVATVAAGIRVDDDAALVQAQQLVQQAQQAPPQQAPAQPQAVAHQAEAAQQDHQKSTMDRIVADRFAAEKAVVAKAVANKAKKATGAAEAAKAAKTKAIALAEQKVKEVADATVKLAALQGPLHKAEEGAEKGAAEEKAATIRTRDAIATHAVTARSEMEAVSAAEQATKKAVLYDRISSDANKKMDANFKDLQAKTEDSNNKLRKSASVAEKAKQMTAEEVVAAKQADEANTEKANAYKWAETTKTKAEKAIKDEEVAAFAASAGQFKAREAIQKAHRATAEAFGASFKVVEAAAKACSGPDKNPMCPTWVEKGECAANPAFMNKDCSTSCCPKAEEADQTSLAQVEKVEEARSLAEKSEKDAGLTDRASKSQSQ